MLSLSRVGLYDDHILPRILCLAEVSGQVLEVGFGSGHNLPYYSNRVERAVAIDPSLLSAKLARKRIERAAFPVEYLTIKGEEIPAADASFDSVVSTFTLCTIPDVAAALRQMRRVLKPGGRFFFVEHGRSSDPAVRRWQDRLNGLQKFLCGGCHLNRDIEQLIVRAGFELLTLEKYYGKGPKISAHFYRGIARARESNEAKKHMPAKSKLLWIALASLILPEMIRAQERPIVIRATTLIDGKGGVMRNVSIVVQGARITRIGANAQGTTYDLKGLTVMPGWIDTHVHMDAHFDPNGKSHSPASAKDETPQQTMLYAVENAYNVLMAGFTTVQSVGAPLDRDLRNAIARGTIPGPRLLTSLRPVDETSGTPEQIRAFVRQVVAEGADLIKIFATKSIREGGGPTLTQAQVDAACGEARSLGKRAIVHAQGPEGAMAAVLAGCTSVEHGYRLTDAVLDLMAQHGTYYDPNFGLLLHNYIENKEKFLGIGNFNAQGFEYMEKGIPIGIDTFKRALTRKIKMVFGTDVGAGGLGRNFEEFIYRVRDGGQPPMEAIISATSRAAESIRMQDNIGVLAPGMEADIIAVDGNPLDDMTAFRRVVFVMKAGKVYKNIAPGRTTGN